MALNLYWFLNERPPRFLHLAGKHDYARQNRAQGDTKVSNTEINRKALWITIAVLLGLLVCRLSVDFVFGAGASSVPEMPEVTFLGEGPGTFNNESGDFVVKAKPFDMVLREGPEYQAKKNERVWAVEEGTTRPVHINDDAWTISVFDKAGCTVGYTIIDDDVDERMSGFYLNGQLLHAVPQGMVSYGVLEVPEEGILTFRTEDSIGLWADYECPGQPVEFKAYLPLAIGQPLPSPEPTCTDYAITVDHSGGVESFPLVEGSSEPILLVGDGESGIQAVGRVLSFTSELRSTLSFSLGSGGYWVSSHYLGEEAGRRESWSMVAYGPRSSWTWNPNETASWDVIETPHSEHVLTTIRGTTPDGKICGRSFVHVVDPPLNRSTNIRFDTAEGPVQVDLSK